jgi:hypothetical protein
MLKSNFQVSSMKKIRYNSSGENMKKSTFFSLICIMGAAVFLTACGGRATAPEMGATTIDSPAANEKTGTTSKTGKVIRTGDKYYLEMMGKDPLEIDSYTLDLSTYMGKTVTVTGQYSGNTLFIGQVE